jgi:nucleotide-binding universal stress UspA family protein
VLALSGVEAIANLTGVMKKPVFTTARKSIWVVAAEVAVFNLLLAVIMISRAPARDAHTEDMLAYMARVYIGAWGEWPVRIIGGLLLLSATNTAVNGLMSITYVMSRDGEMPQILQKLNSFGAPWVCAVLATAVPVIILLFAHDLETLASLYAIGVVGAVAINCSLCSFHPRLRKMWRKICMGILGFVLILIWVTLATTKLHALIFVTIVLAVGLILRQVTKAARARRPKPSLLRQAIMEQLPPDALTRPKVLLATAGSDTLADEALKIAKQDHAALVVSFIREVALSYKIEAESKLTLDTDPAAQALFTDFLEHGHKRGVPIIPVYDTGHNAVELLAEHAAINGVNRVLIGSSRRGTIHHMIKGSFQRKLENLLPPEIPVQVVSAPEA